MSSVAAFAETTAGQVTIVAVITLNIAMMLGVAAYCVRRDRRRRNKAKNK